MPPEKVGNAYVWLIFGIVAAKSQALTPLILLFSIAIFALSLPKGDFFEISSNSSSVTTFFTRRLKTHPNANDITVHVKIVTL